MMKKIMWFDGPISSQWMVDFLNETGNHPSIGAVDTFWGIIRKDAHSHSHSHTQHIVYTCYRSMADQVINQIVDETLSEFNLKIAWVAHSLGKVDVGQASLLVMVASQHRKNAFDGCRKLVERIKSELPVWGEEWLANGTKVWKENN